MKKLKKVLIENNIMVGDMRDYHGNYFTEVVIEHGEVVSNGLRVEFKPLLVGTIIEVSRIGK